MFGLLRTLFKDQRLIGLSIFPSLVFAYNATPHSTTGFQPYQLMFSRKAPAPCDTWLELGVYNDNKLTNKVQWVDQHAEQLLAANKQAMKNIKAAEAKIKDPQGEKRLTFHQVIWCYSGITPGRSQQDPRQTQTRSLSGC